MLASDWDQAFAFYADLFGWQRAVDEFGPTEMYQPFSAGGQTIGGMFTKPATDPVPYWQFYFNIGDIDALRQMRLAIAYGSHRLYLRGPQGN